MRVGVYLDYNATTPVLPEVVEAMIPYFRERYGNAASPHLWGKEAQDAVEKVRALLAEGVGASPKEIIFTSGATESLNLALFGLVRAYEHTGRRHILVSAIEHKAVLDPAKVLAQQGWEVELLPVDSDGLVSPQVLQERLRPETLVVAVMLANNETGVIQPVAELASMAHAHGAFFMCDTTQAIGKIAVSFSALGVDLAVLSAHKFYGPKGVGALYVRRRSPRVVLHPIIFGGGHEGGLRSGTVAVPLIVGMGAAFERVVSDLEEEAQRQAHLRVRLLEGIQKLYPPVQVNGANAPRLPNTLSVSFPGLSASDILARAPLLGAATGSACTSARPEPSHVLLAMGCPPAIARSTLRFSIGRFTTEREIDQALAYLAAALQSLTPHPTV
ncbi:MAG: cysteine desulfurase family protein [Bacteroidia bacterium]|nr:cysteine desulfurase [Bacteroidia bacterium]MDW8014979.1 cysteine desulfurase family protein [Bacteroidia bacterium]